MADRDTSGPTCKFDVAWRGPCGKPTDASEMCTEHQKLKCTSCGEPANHDCDYTGQFVCGAPLCPKCGPHREKGADTGRFFMAHEHRPKSAFNELDSSMTILSRTQKIDAQRFTAGEVDAPKRVYVTGADARFAQNDEPDGDSTRILSYRQRMRQHEEAKDAIRLAGIRTESELLALLQFIHANTGAFALERKEALLDVCCDLEDDINAPPAEVPEAYSGRERGELDAQTAGVRNRG